MSKINPWRIPDGKGEEKSNEEGRDEKSDNEESPREKAAGAKRKPNAAFMKKLTVSEALAAVIGAEERARTEVVKALWKYIKKFNLQDPKNKRNILADDKLKKVFGGKAVVNMFEMTKLVSKHLK